MIHMIFYRLMLLYTWPVRMMLEWVGCKTGKLGGEMMWWLLLVETSTALYMGLYLGGRSWE